MIDQVTVSRELLRQVIEKAEATTRHFNIERLGESTYKDTNTRCELHEAVNKLRVALEQPAVLTAPVGDSNFESWYATYDPSGKGDKQRARDAYAAALEQPAVEDSPCQ